MKIIRILFLVFALVLVSASAGSAFAQTATFPAGCASGLGYSVTTGDPCNGEDEAFEGNLPGCSSALGYSTVDGRACSGGDVAISFLAGCNSIYGYSVINGMPCNGTSVAVLPGTTGGTVAPPSSSPGFPTTGYDGNSVANALYLGSSALIALLGIGFLAKRSNA